MVSPFGASSAGTLDIQAVASLRRGHASVCQCSGMFLEHVAVGRDPPVVAHRAMCFEAAMHDDLTIRSLTMDDQSAAVAVINTAAEWYSEFLPPDGFHEPEMTEDEWHTEARRMTWYGAFDGDALVGVMGLEYSGDAALLRHAYVLPDYQRRGVASMLHGYLEDQVRDVERIIVGTYADNYKARGVLEKGGYRLSNDSEAVLRTYYDIPDDRMKSSVTYEKDNDGRT